MSTVALLISSDLYSVLHREAPCEYLPAPSANSNTACSRTSSSRHSTGPTPPSWVALFGFTQGGTPHTTIVELKAWGDAEATAAPSNLSATAASSSQINLTWTDDAGNEQGFKIERCAGAGCTNFAQIATAGANVTSYSNTGLTPSTSYTYRVRAYNTSGDSAYSNTASATTAPAPAVPAAPTNLIAKASSRSQINLTWTDNAGDETGFRIERCKGSTCTNFTQITSVGANVTTFANTGLNKNAIYHYRARAYNAAGTSAYSNIASATTSR
jgi:tripartite motif-containing protein 71